MQWSGSSRRAKDSAGNVHSAAGRHASRKGVKTKKQDFAYVIPAILMELPGNWIRVSGEIDAVGVHVRKVEILNEHPVFVKSLAAAAQTPYNKNKKRR